MIETSVMKEFIHLYCNSKDSFLYETHHWAELGLIKPQQKPCVCLANFASFQHIINFIIHFIPSVTFLYPLKKSDSTPPDNIRKAKAFLMIPGRKKYNIGKNGSM